MRDMDVPADVPVLHIEPLHAEKELFERTDWICRSHRLHDGRGDTEGHYHIRRMAEGTRLSVQ